jgi:uncharacterized protein (DUF1501 family)
MNRRHFLQLASLAGLGAYTLGHSTLAFAAGAARSPQPKRLIVVILRGAVDGLSIVAPYAEAAYYQKRSSIAIARPDSPNGLLDLDGYFGLHPALAPLMPRWQSGQLGFVHASGSPDPTRSHFDAQDYLESATPGKKSTQDGWMNRLIGTLPSSSSPLTALSVGEILPRILSGPQAVSNFSGGKRATKSTLLDRPRFASAFAELYADKTELAQAYQTAQQSRHEIQMNLRNDMDEASNGAPPPDGFPADASKLATLMRRDAKIQLAFVGLGGWDTHINQGNSQGQLANKLTPLGLGLEALASGLGSVWDDTVILVMSEFGRTVQQNGTGGTDHGHGNVMWYLGGQVAGGKVRGQWPTLNENALYEGRDLAVTTDFRSVIASILLEHYQLSPAQLKQVLPLASKTTMTGLMRS